MPAGEQPTCRVAQLGRARALLCVARMRLASLALVLLAGCSSSGPTGDRDAGIACPAIAPADGQPCDAVAACVYEHCASNGIVRASCVSEDGGAAHWAVSARACTSSCGGMTCLSPQVCRTQSAGAQILGCATHTCGQGPLNCACACGAGIACTIDPSATDDALFDCQPGCGASICP